MSLPRDTPASGLRVSDAERAQVADRLSAHAAAGRLTVDELEERLERAHAAVYGRDLVALEADLPSERRPARTYAAPVRRPGPPLALVPLLLAVAIVGSIAAGHPLIPLFVLAAILLRLAHRGQYGGAAR